MINVHEEVIANNQLRIEPGIADGNVFEVGHSNYSSLFEGYYDIERQTLVFPNDSLRLGQANKEKLLELAERINPETDIPDLILDEACWAHNKYWDEMAPRRGVMVTHKRKIEEG